MCQYSPKNLLKILKFDILRKNPMDDKEKNGIWAEIEQKSPDLLDAFMSFQNKDELKAFFRDLMSERDLREFAMRWEIAKMLDAGMSFTQIQEKWDGDEMVSANTITKINRWLKEGCGGYKTMIDRLKNK
jgi:TrpR-related protein YerC/YecD